VSILGRVAGKIKSLAVIPSEVEGSMAKLQHLRSFGFARDAGYAQDDIVGLSGFFPFPPCACRALRLEKAVAKRSCDSKMLTPLAFYLFAAVTLISAFMVITAKSPVHSVLFLILAFFNAAGLFVLLGAEFVAMILVIVYVGAVAVLFLFVVMMLDMGFEDLRKGAMQYVPLGLIVGGILMVELVMVYGAWQFAPDATSNVANPLQWTTSKEACCSSTGMEQLGNTESLGMLLYTKYVYAFQAAGLVLLVAMIGAIVLTHRQRPGVRRQKISAQNNRKREEAMEIVKINPGQGI